MSALSEYEFSFSPRKHVVVVYNTFKHGGEDKVGEFDIVVTAKSGNDIRDIAALLSQDYGDDVSTKMACEIDSMKRRA